MPDGHFDFFKPRQANETTANSDVPIIIVFDVLQILGLVFISATLCTVWFSSGIRRSTGWFSFTFSWGLTCIGPLIVRHQMRPSPGSVICLCSAMLLYAFPALNALTFVVFVLEIFLSISYPSFISRTTRMVLYFVPYGVFAGILIMVFILGRFNPTAVHKAPFGKFCHLSIAVPAYVLSAIVICSAAISLTLGVCITLHCRRYWSTSRILLIHNGTPFGLVLRVGLIGALSILTIGLAVANVPFERNKDLILSISIFIIWAAFPAAVAIIFGSQEDILRVWMFWRKPPQPLPIPSDTLVTSRA